MSGEEARECGIVQITRDHLETIERAAQLMMDMLGPMGFRRDELVAIVQPVAEAVQTAVAQLHRVGKPAPETAS